MALVLLLQHLVELYYIHHEFTKRIKPPLNLVHKHVLYTVPLYQPQEQIIIHWSGIWSPRAYVLIVACDPGYQCPSGAVRLP